MEEPNANPSEGIFMDVEEIDLLRRYHTDNPTFTTFTETDHRCRNLEERLVESDLERTVKRCHQLMRERRQLLTRDQDIQTLPLHPTVPTVSQLREMRNALVAEWGEVPHQAAFVGIADVLAKEVAYTEESRNTLPHALLTLISHYKKQKDVLSRKLLKYIARWTVYMANVETSVQLRQQFHDRMSKVQQEYEFSIEAAASLSSYLSMHQATTNQATAGASPDGAPAGPPSPGSTAHNTATDAATDSRIADELNPLFFRAYLANVIFESKATKKFERFSSVCQMIPQTKRYEIYTATMTHLIGGFSCEGAEASNGVPLAVKDENEILRTLSDLCTCFKVSTPDQTNAQQFMYNVSKKYTAVFQSQNMDWVFDSNITSENCASVVEIAAGGSSNSKNAKSNAAKNSASAVTVSSTNNDGSATTQVQQTILRDSKRLKECQLQGAQSGWAHKQETLLALAFQSDGEAKTLLKAELDFLSETDITITLTRWKGRSERSVKKSGRGGARHNGGHDTSDPDLLDDNNAGNGKNAQGGATAAKGGVAYQRALAAMQLRFLRAREFRRRLLSTLNYFASVYHTIAVDSHPDGRAPPSSASNVATMRVEPLICGPEEEMHRQSCAPMISPDATVPTQDSDNFTTQLLSLYESLNTSQWGLIPGTNDAAAQNTSQQHDGNSTSTNTAVKFATAQYSADTYERNNANHTLSVKRWDGRTVMDSWAVEQLAALENQMLQVGSYYVGKYNSEVHTQAAQAAGQALSPAKNAMQAAARNNDPMSLLNAPVNQATLVDYSVVAEDLLESETWFQEGKMKLLDVLREAYDHTTDRVAQSNMAKQMLTLIQARPRFDLTDTYFTTSYTRDVINLELKSTLGKEILSGISSEERKLQGAILASKPAPLPTANPVKHQAAGGASPAVKGGGRASLASETINMAGSHALDGTFKAAAEAVPFQQQRSGKLFGLADPPMQDTRLFFSLFPGSQLTNVMDIYSSLSVVDQFMPMVDHAISSLASRFNLLNNSAALQIIEKEILQEMLINWRVLCEEDRVSRQIIQKTVPEADATSDAAVDNIETLDSVIATILAEEEDTKHSAPSSTPAEKAAQLKNQGKGAAASKLVPPSSQIKLQIAAIELITVRRQLMKALYETEICYAIHRRQGKMMGVNVKKSQLEPIDFETRRAFNAVDDLEQLRESNNPLEDVLAVKAEMLCNLSIGEFEASMAQFDLVTTDGLRRVLEHGLEGFRLAYTVQVCVKNMLTSVILCHMACLDNFFETGMKQKYEQTIKIATHFIYPVDPATGLERVRCRLPLWSGFRAPGGGEGEQFSVDRPLLQKLFISVNAIKSHHRKHILASMNERTSEIMSSKKPETLRKVLRDIKTSLVKEFCVAVTFATYQYAAKYHVCALSHVLSMVCSDHQDLNFFTVGSKIDVVRPAPRGTAAIGEARRPATCMLTKNGRLDEVRYLPHVSQILQLDFSVKDSKTAVKDTSNPKAAGKQQEETSSGSVGGSSPSSQYARQNYLLSSMARILHHWCGITRLLRSTANLKISSGHAISQPDANIEIWRQELTHISNEFDILRDPTEISMAVTFLYQAHSTAFMKMHASLNSVRYSLARYNNHRGARKVANALITLEQYVAGQAFPNNAALFSLSVLEQVAAMKSADEKLRVGPYYSPLMRLKLSLSGDLDTAITESEAIPAASLPVHPDEAYFYHDIQRNSFSFVGDEVRPVYPSLDALLLNCVLEERCAVFNESSKLDTLIEDAKDELSDLSSSYGAQARTAVGHMLLPHHDLLRSTVRRDRLRELFYTLYVSSVSDGWQKTTKSQKAEQQKGGAAEERQITNTAHARAQMATHLDDLFSRSVLSRGRTLYERELSERNESKGKKKGKGHEREIRRRQVLLIVLEVNKLLLERSCAEAISVKVQLEECATRQETMTVALNSVLPFRTSVFSDFVTLVTSRALCTRNEGDRVATYHIPESSLSLALDSVGRRISTWEMERSASLSNMAESIARKLVTQVVLLDLQVRHLKHEAEVAEKALPRRVQAAIADTKFDLLSQNGSLEKQVQALQSQLRNAKDAIRDEVRVEYDGRIASLNAQLMLSDDKFKSYKKKMARDMQQSLEEIKHTAMLSVGQMENAPLHMKRQALKIAISDDELNTLKEQNAELKLAVVKTKLWYELKLMRAKAAFEKKLHESTNSIEASRDQYWDTRQVTEGEITTLKTTLSAVQYQLSQSEIEVEMLRRDIQLQMMNKKDLVASKVQHAKTIEDLQKKLRKFEKWTASNLDLEKIVADYEARSAAKDGTQHDAIGDSQTGGRRKSSVANTALLTDTLASSQARPSSVPVGAVAQEEHKRLLEKYEREKKLKEKAFAKIDEMRGEDAGTNEAMIWQRKYFEASSELQRASRDVDSMRNVLNSHGIPYSPAPAISASPLLQPGTATPGNVGGPSALRSFHSAGATPSRPPSTASVLDMGTASKGRPLTSITTAQRPPASRFPVNSSVNTNIPKGRGDTA